VPKVDEVGAAANVPGAQAEHERSAVVEAAAL
jgi:hypothetical protein